MVLQVDAREGVVALDQVFADILRRRKLVLTRAAIEALEARFKAKASEVRPS